MLAGIGLMLFAMIRLNQARYAQFKKGEDADIATGLL